MGIKLYQLSTKLKLKLSLAIKRMFNQVSFWNLTPTIAFIMKHTVPYLKENNNQETDCDCVLTNLVAILDTLCKISDRSIIVKLKTN